METQILYDEPNAIYHANPAIGSGAIRAYLESPQLFYDYQNGLRNDRSDALLFGIASHIMLLEPETFNKHCAIKPPGLNLATKEGKEWKAQHSGLIPIPDEKAQDLQRMHDRMPREVRELMKRCRKEVTVRTEIDGLAVQCRPDLWDMDGSCKYDLKTVAHINAIDGAIWKHGYYVQDRWYSHVIKAATGKKIPVSDLIFVEKNPPYRWRIVSLDPDYQSLGDHQIGIALRGIAERTKSGVWLEEEDALRDIASPPDWATEHFDLTTEDEE